MGIVACCCSSSYCPSLSADGGLPLRGTGLLRAPLRSGRCAARSAPLRIPALFGLRPARSACTPRTTDRAGAGLARWLRSVTACACLRTSHNWRLFAVRHPVARSLLAGRSASPNNPSYVLAALRASTPARTRRASPPPPRQPGADPPVVPSGRQVSRPAVAGLPAAHHLHRPPLVATHEASAGQTPRPALSPSGHPRRSPSLVMSPGPLSQAGMVAPLQVSSPTASRSVCRRGGTACRFAQAVRRHVPRPPTLRAPQGARSPALLPGCRGHRHGWSRGQRCFGCQCQQGRGRGRAGRGGGLCHVRLLQNCGRSPHPPLSRGARGLGSKSTPALRPSVFFRCGVKGAPLRCPASPTLAPGGDWG